MGMKKKIVIKMSDGSELSIPKSDFEKEIARQKELGEMVRDSVKNVKDKDNKEEVFDAIMDTFLKKLKGK